LQTSCRKSHTLAQSHINHTIAHTRTIAQSHNRTQSHTIAQSHNHTITKIEPKATQKIIPNTDATYARSHDLSSGNRSNGDNPLQVPNPELRDASGPDAVRENGHIQTYCM